EIQATIRFPSFIAWRRRNATESVPSRMTGRGWNRLLMRCWVWATVVLLIAAVAAAQETPRTVNPREFGLDLPVGVVAAGEKQAVTTVDDEGQPVVGRIHVRVG